jgi:hypothetical protein
MNLGVPTLGAMSLYFLVGYLASLSGLILSLDIKTTFYTELFGAMQKSPVASLVVAAPFVLLFGIFINTFRIAIVRHLMKRQTYDFGCLPAPLIGELRGVIAAQLHMREEEVSFGSDRDFEAARQLLMPDGDEYVIRARWLYDLFENTLLLALYSVIVILYRFIVFDLQAADWALLICSLFGGLFSVIAMPDLKKLYTMSEVSLVLKNRQASVTKSSAGNGVKKHEV